MRRGVVPGGACPGWVLQTLLESALASMRILMASRLLAAAAAHSAVTPCAFSRSKAGQQSTIAWGGAEPRASSWGRISEANRRSRRDKETFCVKLGGNREAGARTPSEEAS